jgi:hypothetical protein
MAGRVDPDGQVAGFVASSGRGGLAAGLGFVRSEPLSCYSHHFGLLLERPRS